MINITDCTAVGYKLYKSHWSKQWER